MHSPPINSQRSWRVFPIRWKLGMVTNYCAVNYLRLLWSDYDCSVRDTHLFISFARWDFFGSDSTDCCTWKVALEAKPDETPDASLLYCKSFNTTSWLQRPKCFLLSLVFCASSHMCCLLNITYAKRGSISTRRQPFPRFLAPRLQISTVNIKRASSCAGGAAEYSGTAHTDGTSVHAGDNSLIPPSVQWTVSWVPGLALASRHQTTSTSAAATRRKWSVCFVVEIWTCRWFLVGA